MRINVLIFIYLCHIINDMVKKCFFCCSSNVVRNGRRGSSQMYKCKDCGKQFIGGKRRGKSQVITDYVEGNKPCSNLPLSTKFPREQFVAIWKICALSVRKRGAKK